MKRILLILAIIYVPIIMSAQSRYNHRYTSHSRAAQHKKQQSTERYYLRAGIGYAFTHAGQVYSLQGAPYSGNATYINNGTTISSFKFKKASLGAGMYFSIAAGRMFTQHIGIDLSGSFGLLPTKYTFNANGWLINNVNPANSSIIEHAKLPIFLTPAIVLQTGGQKINLYTRLGIVLPLNTRSVSQNSHIYTDTSGGSNGIHNLNYTYETSYSFSLGLSGALGISTHLNEHLKLWGEISALSLSVYAKKATITAYSINGQSYPPSQVSPNVITYGMSGSNTNIYNNTGTQPSDAISYSNIGVNAGITYDF